MNVQEALMAANAVLRTGGIDDPARDTRAIMASVLGLDPSRMTLHLRDTVSETQEARFWASVQARMDRVPVSHIIGERLFYGRKFIVTSDVLDPRPETEELVAAALRLSWSSVLDLGTGSGCILLSLLAERAEAHGIGTDVSSAALAVARRNAAALHLTQRAAFGESDWFSAVDSKFDLIVSNPPYIAAAEMAGLSAELEHEPRMALTDGGDGLSCYREIVAGAPDHLVAGGFLMVEIGPTQGAAVCAMFNDAGLREVDVRCDMDGRDRVILGQKPH